MREILFRGKDEGTKKWVQGYYLKGATRHCITYSLAYYPRYDVIPETVGQYTGLTDKNGKKIFEHDILKTCVYDYNWATEEVLTDEHINVVNFVDGCFEVDITHSADGYNLLSCLYKEITQNSEVICNVFDNPELLEGCKE